MIIPLAIVIIQLYIIMTIFAIKHTLLESDEYTFWHSNKSIISIVWWCINIIAIFVIININLNIKL